MDLLLEATRPRAYKRDSVADNNIGPMLIQLITSDDSVKAAMLQIAIYLVHSGPPDEIGELVENNLITVLCRIIERDPSNQGLALQLLQKVLENGETGEGFNLYKVLAEECRVQRLLNTTAGSPDATVARYACEILSKFWGTQPTSANPKALIPASVKIALTPKPVPSRPQATPRRGKAKAKVSNRNTAS